MEYGAGANFSNYATYLVGMKMVSQNKICKIFEDGTKVQFCFFFNFIKSIL